MYRVVNPPPSVGEPPPPVEDPTYTLYKCEIPLVASTPKKFRLFLCHDSRFTTDSYIGVVASVSSGTATVNACAGNQGTGICLAKAQLFHTLDGFTPDNANLSTTEKTLRVYDLLSNSVLDAVLEFTITASENCMFRFRECIGVNGVTGIWSDPVAYEGYVPITDGPDPDSDIDPRIIHCRGWWPSSAIIVECGSLDVTPPVQIPPGGTGPHRTVSVFDAGGADTDLYKKQSADTFGTTDGNKGGYGVNMRHNFTVSNSSPTAVPTYLHFAARNTGESWFGAAQIVLPTIYTARGVPSIHYPDATHANNAANLTTSTSGVLPISVPAGTVDLPVSVISASGSGSALPVNLLMSGGYAGTGGSGSED